jgi:hypothetical protein
LHLVVLKVGGRGLEGDLDLVVSDGCEFFFTPGIVSWVTIEDLSRYSPRQEAPS